MHRRRSRHQRHRGAPVLPLPRAVAAAARRRKSQHPDPDTMHAPLTTEQATIFPHSDKLFALRTGAPTTRTLWRASGKRATHRQHVALGGRRRNAGHAGGPAAGARHIPQSTRCAMQGIPHHTRNDRHRTLTALCARQRRCALPSRHFTGGRDPRRRRQFGPNSGCVAHV